MDQFDHSQPGTTDIDSKSVCYFSFLHAVHRWDAVGWYTDATACYQFHIVRYQYVYHPESPQHYNISNPVSHHSWSTGPSHRCHFGQSYMYRLDDIMSPQFLLWNGLFSADAFWNFDDFYGIKIVWILTIRMVIMAIKRENLIQHMSQRKNGLSFNVSIGGKVAVHRLIRVPTRRSMLWRQLTLILMY